MWRLPTWTRCFGLARSVARDGTHNLFPFLAVFFLFTLLHAALSLLFLFRSSTATLRLTYAGSVRVFSLIDGWFACSWWCRGRTWRRSSRLPRLSRCPRAASLSRGSAWTRSGTPCPMSSSASTGPASSPPKPRRRTTRAVKVRTTMPIHC